MMRKEKMRNAQALPDYTLSDFYVASFLICSGLNLVRAERVAANRVAFVLQDSPRRAELIQDFYARRARVDPLEYKGVITNLKALIHGLPPENAGVHGNT